MVDDSTAFTERMNADAARDTGPASGRLHLRPYLLSCTQRNENSYYRYSMYALQVGQLSILCGRGGYSYYSYLPGTVVVSVAVSVSQYIRVVRGYLWHKYDLPAAVIFNKFYILILCKVNTGQDYDIKLLTMMKRLNKNRAHHVGIAGMAVRRTDSILVTWCDSSDTSDKIGG